MGVLLESIEALEFGADAIEGITYVLGHRNLAP